MPDAMDSLESSKVAEPTPYAEFKLIQFTHPLHSKQYRLKQPLPIVIEKRNHFSSGLFQTRTTPIRLWRYNRRCFARI